MKHSSSPRRLTVLALVTGLLALSTGCDSGPTDTIVPVAGRITLDGEPLVGATVTFTPQVLLAGMGSSSIAVTDRDGRFQLEIADSGTRGAYVGLHRVEIRLGVAESEFVDDLPLDQGQEPTLVVGKRVDPHVDALPVCFNDESGIFLDVKGHGPNDLVLELRELAGMIRH